MSVPWTCPPGKGLIGRIFAGLLYWVECHPNAWGDSMEETTLLLEGLFKTIICYLRMSTRHPNQHFHRVSPPLHLIIQPCLLRLCVTNQAVKVAPYGDHTHPQLPEVCLLPLKFLWLDYQDDLGWLWEVAPRRSQHHHVLHMLLESLKLPS